MNNETQNTTLTAEDVARHAANIKQENKLKIVQRPTRNGVMHIFYLIQRPVISVTKPEANELAALENVILYINSPEHIKALAEATTYQTCLDQIKDSKIASMDHDLIKKLESKYYKTQTLSSSENPDIIPAANLSENESLDVMNTFALEQAADGFETAYMKLFHLAEMAKQQGLDYETCSKLQVAATKSNDQPTGPSSN